MWGQRSIPTGNALWLGGSGTDVVADKQHYGTHYGDITDSGVLIGTYRDAEGASHAARWFCS